MKIKCHFFQLVLIVFFSAFVYTNAQVNLEWVKTYQGPANGGESYLLKTDNTGNIISAGNNNGSGVAVDIVTIKYKANGDSLWGSRYTCGGQSNADGLETDASGNVYVTGFASVSGQPKCITIKYSSTGELLWEKYYESTPDNRSIGIGIDQNGFVYIAASANKNGTDWGIEVVKYNPVNGDTIWTARYDQTSNSLEIPYAMTVDPAGNVYVTGYSQDSGIIKALVVKFNTDGVYQWANLYYTPGVFGEIRGTAIKADASGNVYISGHCYNGQTTFVDFLTAKYNSSGDTVWVRKYSNPNIGGIDEASDLAIDNYGNVFVTGRSFIGGGGSNNFDYLTLKYSSDGELLWNSLYNGPSGPTQDEARAIALDDYGNCYVTGGSSRSPLFYAADFVTVKYDSLGAQLWSVNHDSYFGGYAIALDGNLSVYVAGAINAHNALIKYYQEPVPVELTSFTAHLNSAGQVELKWSTSTETNNRGFEVERMQSNTLWKKIGYTSGSGTTTEFRNYSFLDKGIETGTYTYRLKQIDYNGAFEYSDEVKVEVILIPGEFAISQNYPNPFNPSTKIKYELPFESSVKIVVYNAIGEAVDELINKVQSAGYYSVNWNASGRTSGIYYYRIEAKSITGEGSFTSVKKMIYLR